MPRTAAKPSPGPDRYAPAHRYRRPGANFAALIGRVVGGVMQVDVTDRAGNAGVPDHEVGIAADRDGSLTRVEAVKLGCVRRSELLEAIDIDPAAQYPLGEQQRHARLDAGNAVGHLMKTAAGTMQHLAVRVVVIKRRVIR